MNSELKSTIPPKEKQNQDFRRPPLRPPLPSTSPAYPQQLPPTPCPTPPLAAKTSGAKSRLSLGRAGEVPFLHTAKRATLYQQRATEVVVPRPDTSGRPCRSWTDLPHASKSFGDVSKVESSHRRRASWKPALTNPKSPRFRVEERLRSRRQKSAHQAEASVSRRTPDAPMHPSPSPGPASIPPHVAPPHTIDAVPHPATAQPFPADHPTNLPAADPITTDTPPTTDPPTTDPPTTDPPTTDPPTTDPPTTDPPTTYPPTTNSLTTYPLTTNSPTTYPLTTDPPTTYPLTTDPPTTYPGAARPHTEAEASAEEEDVVL